MIRSPSGQYVTVTIDGRPVHAAPGVPLGAVLHVEYGGAFRRTRRNGAWRGLFCGMGVCFDCIVTVDGVPGCRACMISAADGMHVKTDQR